MKQNMHAALTVAIVTFVSSAASAAPPSSCAGKFIGVWNHGNNNIGTLHASGVASCSGNPFCQQGTWTCDGNTMTYTTSTGTYNYTLQSNGTMTYGHIVVTRIGGKPSPSREPAATPSTAQAPPPAAATARYPEKQVHRNNGNSLRTAAHAAASVGNWAKAEENFENAAAEFEKAGDPTNARIARANAAKVAKAAQGPAARPNRTPPSSGQNVAGSIPWSQMSREERERQIKSYSLRDSLRNKLDKYSRDEQLCAAYTAELNSYTGPSAAYRKELTAAVKGACN